MEREWRCFYCDEVFTDPEAARLHFGEDCMPVAACQFSITAVREMEWQLARYRAEDSDKDREFYRMQAEHTVALRRAEEEGYRQIQKEAADRLELLEDAYADAISALQYIRLHYGELYGVGWARLDETDAEVSNNG
jgi:hypothetical protein